MRKMCAMCPTEFEAKRPAAKYCSEKCRKRAQRKPGETRAPKVISLPADPVDGGVTSSTVAELERAGRLETAVGQAAVALARRIDAAGGETGTALAALVREHRATLADAVKDAAKATDPLDELRMRRERKLGSG